MSRKPVYPWWTWLAWTLIVPTAIIALAVATWAFTEVGDFAYDGMPYAWLLAAAPAAGAVMLLGLWRRRRGLVRFADALAPALATQVQPWRQAARAGLAVLAVLMVSLALIGPRWGTYFEKLEAYGVDIVVALDVSRSMLAEDVTPNRLDRAKQELVRLTFNPSNRLGLLAFAGSAAMKVPLTLDHAFFVNALNMIDLNSAPRGGTAISEAIYSAADFFAASPPKASKIILVCTDGEDHEGDPLLAAQDVFKQYGIRVFTVGVGDPDSPSGAVVPSSRRGQPLTHEGQIVYSRLNMESLARIAAAADGASVPVEGFRSLVSRIDQLEKDRLSSEERKRQRPRYQLFLALGLAALLAEPMIRERRGGQAADELVRFWETAPA